MNASVVLIFLKTHFTVPIGTVEGFTRDRHSKSCMSLLTPLGEVNRDRQKPKNIYIPDAR